jgi:hypothetical protein
MTNYIPGCYGSVLLYNRDDEYCKVCPLALECGPETGRNREIMQKEIGAPMFEAKPQFWQVRQKTALRRDQAQKQSTPKSKLEPASTPASTAVSVPAPVPKQAQPVTKITPVDAMDLPDLKVKVRQELERWAARGINPADLLAGINPFANHIGFKFASAFASGCMKLYQPTKAQLIQEIEAEFAARGESAWSRGSLQSNVNIVLGAFKACGYHIIIKES